MMYEFFTGFMDDGLLGRVYISWVDTLGEMIAAFLAALAVLAVAGGVGNVADIWPRNHSPPI